MQKNKVVRIIAYLGMVALTVIGLLGVIPLVRSELALGDVCPKIIGIPACFIILICLIFITFVSNAIGYVECPKTSGGFPMCYLSFMIFAGIGILRLVERKMS